MDAPRPRFLALGERISRIAVWIGGLMIVLTAGLITAEVLLRKIANISTGGADELSGYALAVGSSWSMGFALLRRAHVRVDALYGQFSATPRAWLDCLAILAMTGFALVLTWFCAGVLQESITLGARSTTTLSIPLWLPQGLWITGFLIFSALGLILSFHAVLALLAGKAERVRHLVGSRTAEEELSEDGGQPPANGGERC
ncbi:TRAP transporter small permease subunit [Albidovulum sediminicola]|uniref:TRAP transporter small permease protein n=1 Tax=Albidovulum sediminicola TaxID=2984331 RepID=A0ABT2Z581_9RHOB|nr:TRAP transporter small permease [Defluviimonas sp. WL0075]MCV2866303.1 TRAP transporter small permease [Defluviimonas sp. WL0075]